MRNEPLAKKIILVCRMTIKATGQLCAQAIKAFLDRSIGLDVVVFSHLFPHLNFRGNQLGELLWLAGQCDN